MKRKATKLITAILTVCMMTNSSMGLTAFADGHHRDNQDTTLEDSLISEESYFNDDKVVETNSDNNVTEDASENAVTEEKNDQDGGVDETNNYVASFESGQDFNDKISEFVGDKKSITTIYYFVDPNDFTDRQYRLNDGSIKAGDEVFNSLVQLNVGQPGAPVYAFSCREVSDRDEEIKGSVDDEKHPANSNLVLYTEAVELIMTSNDYSHMFDGFEKLGYLRRRTDYPDIMLRIVSNTATNMSCMFANCKALKELNMESIATPSVTDMSYMFANCSNLDRLLISDSFDTTKVQNMESMFENCGELDPLKTVTQFNTTNVKDFSTMFKYSGLSAAPDNFNSDKAIDTSGMYWGTPIKEFKANEHFSCNQVQNVTQMFFECLSLENIDFHYFNLGNTTKTSGMLKGCTKLEWLRTFNQYPQEAIELPANDYYMDLENKIQWIGKGYEMQETNRYIGRHMVCIEYIANGAEGHMDDQFGVPNVSVELNENTFTYDGYTFLGWSTTKYEPGTKSATVKYKNKDKIDLKNVQSKVTLYAVWGSKEVNVTFDYQYDNDGDQINDTETVVFQYGKEFGNKVPKSGRTGYSISWNTASDGSGQEVTSTTTCEFLEDTTVYGLYTPVKYSVMFLPNNGTGEMDNQELTYDKEEKLSENKFTRSGYIFVGWGKTPNKTIKTKDFYDKQNVVNIGKTEGELIKLYAIWIEEGKEEIYTINFELNGGYFEKENIAYYTPKDNDIIISNPVKENAEFVGWTGTDIDDYTMNIVITKGSKGNKEFTAHWSDDKFIVKFMLNDAEYHTTEVIYNNKVAKPENPYIDGYSFIGWFTEDGTRFNFDTNTIKNDLTLIARMSKINTKSGLLSDITYDASTNTIYAVKGQSYTLGTTKSGNWATSDKSVVNINKKTGKFSAKRAGTATLRDTATDTEYNINVYLPVISEKKATVQIGGDYKLKLNNVADIFNVSWQSSNPKIAQVIDGNITGVAKGSCKINAFVNGKKYTSSIKVVDKGILPKTYTENTNVTIFINQSFTPKYDSSFNLTSSRKSLDGAQVDAYSNDGKNRRIGIKNDVVQITREGVITGLNAGTSTITLTHNKVTKIINVKVVAEATKSNVYLLIGKSELVKIPGLKSNKLQWSSDNTDIASVDSNGKITATGVGETTVKGKYDKTEYCVKVHAEKSELITDDYIKAGSGNAKYEIRLPENSSYSIRVDSNEQQLNWKSSSTKVAQIDEFGTVHVGKANSKGTGSATLQTNINGTKVSIKVIIDNSVKAPSGSDYSYKTIKLVGGKLIVHITETGKYFVEYI